MGRQVQADGGTKAGGGADSKAVAENLIKINDPEASGLSFFINKALLRG